MDRLLISALFALLAGFLTAVISFVKLVNDKESKISDYREQWTTSAREALATLISKIETLCQILKERAERAKKCNDFVDHFSEATSDLEKELLTEMRDYERSMLEKTNELRRQLTGEINHASNLAKLHFKLNDPDFSGIEAKIDSSLVLLRDIEDDTVANNVERVKDITARVAVLCAGLSNLSRITIKTEWEKVKQGEQIYIKTKMAAKWGGVFFFFIFITVGIHAFIASHKLSERTIRQTASQSMEEPPINGKSPTLEKPLQTGAKNSDK